jgi:hypothetical protein
LEYPQVQRLRINISVNAITKEQTSSMPLGTIVLILLVLILIGSLPVYPYSAGWGYYPAGGLSTILVIVLILYLLGVI